MNENESAGNSGWTATAVTNLVVIGVILGASATVSHFVTNETLKAVSRKIRRVRTLRPSGIIVKPTT